MLPSDETTIADGVSADSGPDLCAAWTASAMFPTIRAQLSSSSLRGDSIIAWSGTPESLGLPVAVRRPASVVDTPYPSVGGAGWSDDADCARPLSDGGRDRFDMSAAQPPYNRGTAAVFGS